eukprot:Skav234952  [mRNA]  locus=scaffold2817:119161:125372:- [translate_table: standard]
MAGQLRVSKESFADMVASSRTKVIRTIPHSLRGMALGQLQHLEALFVRSGWLDGQCESFNRENARAIENGKNFKQSCNLYAMDIHVVTPMTRPGFCAARQLDARHSIPQALQTSSFSELVNPHGLIVHVFVSHYWGHDFTGTVTALQLWAEQRMTSEKAALVESMEAIVFWICLFALNQHQKAEEVGQNPRRGPFNAALAQARDGVLMTVTWGAAQSEDVRNSGFADARSTGNRQRSEAADNEASSTVPTVANTAKSPTQIEEVFQGDQQTNHEAMQQRNEVNMIEQMLMNVSSEAPQMTNGQISDKSTPMNTPPSSRSYRNTPRTLKVRQHPEMEEGMMDWQIEGGEDPLVYSEKVTGMWEHLVQQRAMMEEEEIMHTFSKMDGGILTHQNMAKFMVRMAHS